MSSLPLSPKIHEVDYENNRNEKLICFNLLLENGINFCKWMKLPKSWRSCSVWFWGLFDFLIKTLKRNFQFSRMGERREEENQHIKSIMSSSFKLQANKKSK